MPSASTTNRSYQVTTRYYDHGAIREEASWIYGGPRGLMDALICAQRCAGSGAVSF